ncbi:MAG: PAAR domain-containing protein [Desulfovibrio sp.]|jgi:uncharacterized Zn-binding protein involved in type VI secretion|nr:PAAR domain-containing protein [Desulfovibrio sp.]
MSLKKGDRGVIRLGDVTTHGGKVISVAHTPTDMGIPMACVGDMVECPKCNGVFPIVEGDAECKIMGVPVAFDGHKTACGATLISSVSSPTREGMTNPELLDDDFSEVKATQIASSSSVDQRLGLS